jgi:hypothetical protein
VREPHGVLGVGERGIGGEVSAVLPACAQLGFIGGMRCAAGDLAPQVSEIVDSGAGPADGDVTYRRDHGRRSAAASALWIGARR